jgi:hypothetical protein
MERLVFVGLLLLGLVVACGPVNGDDEAGSLGRECYPNGTCNVGLVCALGFCEIDSGPSDVTSSVDMFGSCESGTGCFGSVCTSGDECEAQVCAAHLGEFLCTMECTDDCPPDWTCHTPDGSDKKICVSDVPHLCQPCLQEDECGALNVSGSCVSYGDEGRFCSVQCELDSDCPPDYICDALPDQDNDSNKYCINLSGTCSCSAASINDAKETSCAISNEYGKCEGTRSCTSSGLGACDAETPSVEICDGIDNNCNGETDEADGNDTPTWFKDTDGDGYGDAAEAVNACDAPEGHVDNALDCDDNNNTINPDGEEVCDDADNNCNDETDEEGATDATDWYQDKDGDGHGNAGVSVSACNAAVGYVALSDDCNDNDASAYPGATEYCDGIDNNCIDGVDEGDAAPQTYYADFDADGYGTEEITSTGCGSPPNYVLVMGDCNDFNGAISPDAVEVCDEIDNNCDGEIDDGDAAPGTYFADFDNDGFGSNALSITACTMPPNYIDSTGDCNDFDPFSHPEAAETCDGQDNNCDTVVDEGVTTIIYQDNDSDGYGDDALSVAACGLLPGHSFNGGDCDDGNVQIHPGAYELCDGLDNDCDGENDEDPINGLTFFADNDGDGYGDPTQPIAGCTQPASSVPNANDCDDANIDINPVANEIYYDGTDQNCDNKSDFDQDEDGHDSVDFGGDDKNDTNALCFDPCLDGTSLEAAGTTCRTILELFPTSANGTYWIDPDNDGDPSNAFEAYCDMAAGGWTYQSLLTPFTVDFTGAETSITTPNITTSYRFTLYGAQGGIGISQNGGFGGVATGNKTFAGPTTLLIYVGGQGNAGGIEDQGPCGENFGGFNGGGTGTKGGSGGGGATDVRTNNSLDDRILVAGGGGGSGGGSGSAKGGDGGGFTGEQGSAGPSSEGPGGPGGSQSSGGVSPNDSNANGSFGQGGNNAQCNDEGGGGGGWYGGAAGGKSNTSGGGGSSFIGGMDSDASTAPGVRAGHGGVEYIFR